MSAVTPRPANVATPDELFAVGDTMATLPAALAVTVFTGPAVTGWPLASTMRTTGCVPKATLLAAAVEGSVVISTRRALPTPSAVGDEASTPGNDWLLKCSW